MRTVSFLVNWRHFPRAKITFRVRAKVPGGPAWAAKTLDVSLGGCRIAGPLPNRTGDTLQLELSPPDGSEPWKVHGKVIRLENGTAAIAFQADGVARERFKAWLAHAIGDDQASARKVLTETPSRLPLGATVEKGAAASRKLLPEEESLVGTLQKPMTVDELRQRLGPDWERRAQPLFGLVAEGVVKITLPKDVALKPAAEEGTDGFGLPLRTISVTLPLPKQKEATPPPSFVDRLLGRTKR